jgi:hypothetical protein
MPMTKLQEKDRKWKYTVAEKEIERFSKIHSF